MSAPALAAAAAVATRLLRLVKVAVDECIRRAVAYEVRAIAGSIDTRKNCIAMRALGFFTSMSEGRAMIADSVCELRNRD
jgi:hypothetical protein